MLQLNHISQFTFWLSQEHTNGPFRCVPPWSFRISCRYRCPIRRNTRSKGRWNNPPCGPSSPSRARRSGCWSNGTCGSFAPWSCLRRPPPCPCPPARAPRCPGPLQLLLGELQAHLLRQGQALLWLHVLHALVQRRVRLDLLHKLLRVFDCHDEILLCVVALGPSAAITGKVYR